MQNRREETWFEIWFVGTEDVVMLGDTIQEPDALVKECGLRMITSGVGEGRLDGPLHELFGRRVCIYRSEIRVRFRRVQSEERIVVDWVSVSDCEVD